MFKAQNMLQIGAPCKIMEMTTFAKVSICFELGPPVFDVILDSAMYVLLAFSQVFSNMCSHFYVFVNMHTQVFDWVRALYTHTLYFNI